MIYNVMLVSGVRQNDFIYIYIYLFLFKLFFPFSLIEHIFEQSSLCYTIGPYWLSTLNIVVCKCQSQTLNLSLLKNLHQSRNGSVLGVCMCVYVCYEF